MPIKINHKIQNLVIAIFFMVLWTPATYANEYLVKDVKVDVEAESAIDARGQALNKARRNAFNILTGRLVNEAHKSSIPYANDDVIASMVDSFEINREKLSKNRYLASVNVAFNERAVQAYVGRYTNAALPDQDYQTPSSNLTNDHSVSAQDRQIQHSNLYGQHQRYRQERMRDAIPYKMKINLNGLSHWVRVQNALESIGNVAIHSLNASRVIVTLSYQGDAVGLQQAMNMKGMQLFSNTQADAYSVPYVLMVRG